MAASNNRHNNGEPKGSQGNTIAESISNKNTHPESRGVQVIARAAQIMRTLQKYPQGMTRSQLASEVELARSTVHRIVGALIEERLVTADPLTGSLQLGSGLLPLAAAVNNDLRRELRPYLEQLHREITETVDLSRMVGNQVRFIDQIAAPHRLQAVSAIGVEFPLHCTASGKAFLAARTPAEAQAVLPEKLTPLTDQTITSQLRLMDELARVRADGIAYDREEHTIGICAVGAAIRMPLGELVSISIPVPSQRFYGNEEKLSAALLSTVEQIRQTIGR